MDGGVSQALLSTMVTHYSYFFIVHVHPRPFGTTGGNGDWREGKGRQKSEEGALTHLASSFFPSFLPSLLEQEKGDKSETAKQLTGEYKDFYRTLRKVSPQPLPTPPARFYATHL